MGMTARLQKHAEFRRRNFEAVEGCLAITYKYGKS
jgi:hypothetical protein